MKANQVGKVTCATVHGFSAAEIYDRQLPLIELRRRGVVSLPNEGESGR